MRRVISLGIYHKWDPCWRSPSCGYSTIKAISLWIFHSKDHICVYSMGNGHFFVEIPLNNWYAARKVTSLWILNKEGHIIVDIPLYQYSLIPVPYKRILDLIDWIILESESVPDVTHRGIITGYVIKALDGRTSYIYLQGNNLFEDVTLFHITLKPSSSMRHEIKYCSKSDHCLLWPSWRNTFRWQVLTVYHWLITIFSSNIIESESVRSDSSTLRWRHDGHDSVFNHQPHDCLLNRLIRRRSKKTSKFRVTGLCVGNSPGPVNSPHKWPVTRKMFPFDDVIMNIFVISHRVSVWCLPAIAGTSPWYPWWRRYDNRWVTVRCICPLISMPSIHAMRQPQVSINNQDHVYGNREYKDTWQK